MLMYMLKRIASALLTLLAMSALIFVMVRLVGDPAHLLMPPEATDADRALFRQQLGLSDPMPIQYARFLAGLVKGDFGNSFHFGVPALSIVLVRLGPSLTLTLAAMAAALLVGVPLGIASAVWKGRLVEHVMKCFSVAGQAAPPFFFALLMIRFFSVKLGWLPTSGYGGWRHLLLPVLALGWYSAAGLARLTQANLLKVLGSEYILVARLKGVPERHVVLGHALKNALLPIVTFAASQFGILIGGAVSIEAVFAWPGFGSMMVESINQLDFTVVQAAVIVSTLLFILINLAVDVLYAWLDPRIRYGH